MNARRSEILRKIVTLALCLLKIITIGSCQIDCSQRTRYSCGDGTCISKAKVCNGKRDCAGGGDELECHGPDICRPRDENMTVQNGYFCARPCSEDARCRRGSCLCDDECGESCVRRRFRCAEDPPQVEHSLRSYVKRYNENRRVIIYRKRYLFGDVAYYRCEQGRTLRGPLPRCMANGQWSMEIPQCVDVHLHAYASVARVAGGVDATQGAWPWFALITKNSITPEESLRNVKGGGSIINKRWILTAAHVLHNMRLSEFIVFVGLHEMPSRQGFDNSSVEMYSIAEYVEHPEYNRIAPFDSDIALIQLGQKLDERMQQTNVNGDEGLTFRTNIGAISLPDCSTESNQNHLLCPSIGEIPNGADQSATVVGFGDTYQPEGHEGLPPPKKLQQAIVKPKKSTWCLRKLKRESLKEKGRSLIFTGNMLCCGPDRNGITDACKGDSGGPLMRKIVGEEDGTSNWFQIGIVSFGIGCGASGFPGFYTKVEKFTSWIQNITSQHIYQEDCSGVTPNWAKVRNSTGGVFQIYPPSYSGGIQVFCDLTTDGHGWTVFQRRMDGSVDFLRNFQDYVDGFGSPNKEYWMGLDKIHRLTSDGNYELRIDLEDWEGNRRYAKYSTFSVAGASDKYRLRIGGYSGNAGDSLANKYFSHGYLDNQFFSAIDRDNDEAPGEPSCAVQFKGGWWFKLCFRAHLNGLYHQGSAVAEAQGIIWWGWKGFYYSLKFAEMKFRRKN